MQPTEITPLHKLERQDTVYNLKNIFQEKKDKYEKLALKHSSCRRKYQVVYYTVGIITIVLSSIQSLLLGSKSITNVKDKYLIISFVFGLLITIFSMILNFLSIETRINQHNSSKLGYLDLCLDIDKLIVNCKDSHQLSDEFLTIDEKEKMINSYALDPESLFVCR